MADSIVKVRHLTFTYSENKQPTIKDMNFEIEKGSWFSIIGKNGSGKSTITRLLDGLLLPDNANSKIIVNEQKLDQKSVWQIRSQIGIVFQNPDNQFVGATVADDVAFGLENQGIPRKKMLKLVDQALYEVGMEKYKNSEPSNLSGGQKQRVAIAGILVMNPQILILDESTSMLDPQGRKAILTLVKEMQRKQNLTVISITHDLEEVVDADQVLVIKDGKKLACDKPANIFSHSELVKESGLELPFIFKLKKDLEQQGVSIPKNISNESDLINYLCQLNSKM